MDPCPFVRLTVGNLGLKIPVASKPASSVVHPSSSPCFCKIKLKNFPSQIAVVPYISPDIQFPEGSSSHVQTLGEAIFHLSKGDIDKFAGKSLFNSNKLTLKISIYTGRRGSTCGVNSGSLLGKVSVPLDLSGTESKSVVFLNGWINVGKESKNSTAQFHLIIRTEPDPRYVFEFDGEPESSPQVFQIQGSIRQPVFTCKFSFRSTPDRAQRSRSLPTEQSGSRGWLSSFSERERPGRERKGWSVTVHDLSGSPVAAASMVTPFVASPGSDRVSRSNPGCWLILKPGDGTWKPWGRLEAWRERGSNEGLGYRFELITESGVGAGIILAESTLSCSRGGTFVIDLGGGGGNSNNHNQKQQSGRTTPTSPVGSPRGGSGDLGKWYGGEWGGYSSSIYRGFVMSAKVGGEGGGSFQIQRKKSKRGGGGMKATVELSVQHVSCTEDAAAFVALSAAVDLSMDACRLFSQKLRKELCPPQDLLF